MLVLIKNPGKKKQYPLEKNDQKYKYNIYKIIIIYIII